MTAAEPLLEIRGLVKRFGGLVVTDSANLSVDTGEIHALIGPNGAGKTTLIHQLSGALTPSMGTMHFAGQDITSRSMHERVRLGLVRSFQITSIFDRLSVLENLALAVQSHDGSSLRLWHPARADHARYQAAAQIAHQIGLADRKDLIAGALSHGEKRQLEVGLTLALRPRLLLLDEPMAGTGPEESARMVDLLLALRGGITILLVEHDMDAVFRLADRISVLVSGRVIATGTPEQIHMNPEVRRAYLGDELGGVRA